MSQPGTEEAQQVAELRRHRNIATASLVGAVGVYVATQLVEDPSYTVLLVRAGAEAGLIGGIADWFAVVALFRRPLGLPIPHTAILPRNKERLGAGLGRFVARHFLDPEVVQGRLRSSEPARRLGDWLADRDNSALVAERLLALAPDVIRAFEDREVRGFYSDTFRDQLRRLDLAPMVQRLVWLFMESRQHQRLFDRSLRLARELLVANRQVIYRRVEEKSSWWIPRRFDHKLAEAIVGGVEEWLEDLSDPGHKARKEFDRAVWAMARGMQGSDAVRERLDMVRDQLLESPELQQILEQIWSDLRAAALDGVDQPDSVFRQSLVQGLQRFGRTLLDDPEARSRLDDRMTLLLRELILPFRDSIGEFIADVVRDWDSEGLSRRLELTVGRDLQFIRINGTLVGALVGMAIFVVSGWVF